MAIAKRSLFLQTLLLVSAVSLVACGGGGGGGSKEPAVDTTPNAISFTASTNAEPNAVVTSPAVTITGINTAAPVSISGGEYSINGGAFTSAASTIANGQTLSVRITASDQTNTATSATITVGGVSANFSVTTLADAVPNNFTLAPVTDAAVSAEITSAPVTLSGVDIAVPVSITGGQYSIDGGAFTSTAGTIANGQTLTVKLTASNQTNTSTAATVTVGGVSAEFSVTTSPDVTPNNFTLAPVTNAALGAEVTSASVTLSGFDIAVPVSITGGQYSIDNGAFTSAAGTINPSQTVVVKLTASTAHSTASSAQLTVGGVKAAFNVTTLPDSTPDTFSFAPKTDAELDIAYTSAPITVKGIDTTVPVSITGGLYAINNGAFTAAAGTVSVNQTITVKVTSGNDTETITSATLSIGDVKGTFTVTTKPDETPPVAKFQFPTPYTMSETMNVNVRGTATDDHAITSVKLLIGSSEKEVTPKSEIDGVKDFSTWSAVVPLTANAENEIKVIATDDRGNTTETDLANKVVVRQRVDYSGVFPDSGSPIKTTSGLVLDRKNNRLLYAEISEDRYKISEIDISTASSKIFADFEQEQLSSFAMGVIDQSTQYVYFPLTSAQTILKINLENPSDYSVHENEAYGSTHRTLTLNNTGEVPQLISARNTSDSNSGGIVTTRLDNWETSVLSDAFLGIPDSTIPFDDTSAVVFDQKKNRYLASSTDAVIAVDASTGVRSIFSNESVGSGDAYGAGESGKIKAIALDESRNRLIVHEIFTGNIFAVDLDTAERSVISQITLLHPTSDVWPHNEKSFIGSQIDVENELLYTVHHRVQALMVVDLQSGQQLVLSKAANIVP
jgi:hypothetical protein